MGSISRFLKESSTITRFRWIEIFESVTCRDMGPFTIKILALKATCVDILRNNTLVLVHTYRFFHFSNKTCIILYNFSSLFAIVNRQIQINYCWNASFLDFGVGCSSEPFLILRVFCFHSVSLDRDKPFEMWWEGEFFGEYIFFPDMKS